MSEAEHMPPVPIANAYWVVPGRLLAGEYPGAADDATARQRLKRFLSMGIETFIDLTEIGANGNHSYVPILGELVGSQPLLYHNLPVRDMGLPSVAGMAQTLDTIDAALERGETIYVHCMAGVGRTGMVVGCYLARHGYPGEKALAELARLRRSSANSLWPSPETPAQRNMVLNWPADADSAVRRNRFRGALFGLAAGDALGTTLEFSRPGTFTPIDDMVGGGPFGLKAGQWTDDTSMALCLAASLVETSAFDARDQMQRYVRWWQNGYMSSNGRCFDIGNTTRAALAAFQRSGDPFSGSDDPQHAGNGSLMRLAPVALAFADDPPTAIAHAAASSRTTHAAPAAVDACRYLAGLIIGALNGASKDELLSPRYSPLPGLWQREALDPEVEAVAAGSFKTKEPPAILGSGYVVAALEAALWAFQRSEDFRSGSLLAVNLGDDADTTGAIYGQLAGAYYGVGGIPGPWLAKLALRETIEELAIGLYESGAAEER